MTTALVPRRSFLGRVLAGLAGLAVLDRPARAVTPARRLETVGLHEANVFGLPYHDAPRVLPTLRKFKEHHIQTGGEDVAALPPREASAQPPTSPELFGGDDGERKRA